MFLVNIKSLSKIYTDFFIAEAKEKEKKERNNNQVVKNPELELKSLFQGILVP